LGKFHVKERQLDEGQGIARGEATERTGESQLTTKRSTGAVFTKVEGRGTARWREKRGIKRRIDVSHKGRTRLKRRRYRRHGDPHFFAMHLSRIRVPGGGNT